MPFFTYILKCKDGTLYAGATNDIVKRLHQHNNSKSGAHYTKIRRPVTLVYVEILKTLKAARAKEALIKRMTKGEKLLLIK